ncbi:MAG: hypothetical protein WBN86_10155 [Porticoccaceae bacterium]
MNEAITAGQHAMNRVKAGFILQHTTYRAWCRANDVDPTNGRQAIYGSWNGPKGRALRARILSAAGVREAT